MNKNIVKGPTRIKRQFFRLRVRPSKAPAKSTSTMLLMLDRSELIGSDEQAHAEIANELYEALARRNGGGIAHDTLHVDLFKQG